MVLLLQLFLLLTLIQPITNHVHGNSVSPLPNHSKHSLVSYLAKGQTKASVKKTHHVNILLFHRGETVDESFTDGPITEFKKTHWSTVGTGDVFIPAEIGLMGSSKGTIKSAGKQHAQYRPQVQTVFSVLTTLHTSLRTSPSLQTSLPETAPANEKLVSRPDAQATSSRISPWDVSETRQEIDAVRTIIQSIFQPKKQFTTLPSYSGSTTLSTSTTNLQIKTPLPEVNILSLNYSQQKITTHSTSATISNDQPKGAKNKGAVNSTTDKLKESTTITVLAKTDQKNTKGMTTPLRTTSPQLIGRGRFVLSKNYRKYTERDPFVLHGIVPSVKSSPASSTPVISNEPCATDVDACVSYKDQNDLNKFGFTNGSKLVWADLHRTLSFAWELHVFGSATLFLLLTAGAALGLALAPSMHCPHRSELVLTNILLLVAGAVRTAHFVLDPYGTRLLLPPPVIIALYTLPLPLFILAQTALMIPVLKEAGATLLLPALQHPPLLGILAVLQCTILLAADLLSPALSPVVPTVLQILTLTAGLALCFGYLFLALPQLAHKYAAQAGNKGICKGKVRVLAWVLAVCAFLGALCCLLHVYACLWLYQLLGDWRHFRWGWWFCHFWARLLELAWAFCLLVISSRPVGGQICKEPRQEGAATPNLPSASQSSSSATTYTCWAKIIQTLKVRQQKKSESNGISGSNSGGVVEEFPNNWVGQERSKTDISKSILQNRDPLKDSKNGCNLQSFGRDSTGSLLRLQALAQPSRLSLSNSLNRDKESAISLYDFDLRPPTPIDLSRSIDEALHREHLLRGGSLFQPLCPPSPSSSSRLWVQQNSDPQITLSLSSDKHTLLSESLAGLHCYITGAVPNRQVTVPPTPTHQGFCWVSEVPVPTSLSCPVSLHPSTSTSCALVPSSENTKPFLTTDIESQKVNQKNDSVSFSSGIIDL